MTFSVNFNKVSIKPFATRRQAVKLIYSTDTLLWKNKRHAIININLVIIYITKQIITNDKCLVFMCIISYKSIIKY